MNESQTFQRRAMDAVEEHRQIHFYLDQIALTLDGLSADGGGSETMSRLAAQLEGLKERLVEHHEAEERGGLFEAILEVMPDCRVEISRLINQHEKMIEILELARIHAQHGDSTDAASLVVDLKGFLETFREHEHAEERLMQRAAERESRLVD